MLLALTYNLYSADSSQQVHQALYNPSWMINFFSTIILRFQIFNVHFGFKTKIHWKSLVLVYWSNFGLSHLNSKKKRHLNFDFSKWIQQPKVKHYANVIGYQIQFYSALLISHSTHIWTSKANNTKIVENV